MKEIIRDHLKTLVNANTNRPGLDDYFSFLFLPILISTAFIYAGFSANSTLMKSIGWMMIIFSGLLFNALIHLIGITRAHKKEDIKHIIFRELAANVAFSCLISYLAGLAMFVRFIDGLHRFAESAISYIFIFLFAEFLVTFLMILKRTYLVLKSNF